MSKIKDNYIEIIDEFGELIEKSQIEIVEDDLGEINVGHNTHEELNTSDKTIIGGINEINEHIKNIIVNVKNFGAKGDGVTDDTQAFKEANIYANNLVREIQTTQLISDCGITILIPNGRYIVKGDKIFGSIRNENEYPTQKSIRYEVKSNNATIFWNIENVTDRLFYFDYTITKPTISNILIFTINQNELTSSGTVFHIEGVKNNSGNWLADSSNGNYHNIRICSGRNNNGNGNRAKYIFKILGETMCDQSLVLNCSFEYFDTLFYCENSQAVNWVFNRCNFFSPYNDVKYFHFTKMNDNFIVRDCSFSTFDNQTILYTKSILNTSNKLTERPDYNFIFDSNRVECYVGNNTNYLNVFEGNFGKLILTNTNFLLGSGSNQIKQRFLMTSHASSKLNNVVLNSPTFALPLIDEYITGVGNSDYFGLQINDCIYINSYNYVTYNINTKQFGKVSDKFNMQLVKYVTINNFRLLNSNRIENYEIINCGKYVGGMSTKEMVINESKENSCMGYYIPIPPYQMITKIELLNITIMPNDYNKFRVYFGDKSNSKFVDVENVKPSVNKKTSLILFEGLASIFYDDISLNKIYITCLRSDGSENSMGSIAKIYYSPVNVHSLGISNEKITVIEKEKNILIGNSSQRPINPYPSMMWFDTSINKPIWYEGTNWRDASGNIIY